MSLSDLATEIESLFNYTFKEGSFLLSEELNLARKIKPKRQHFKLSKVLFIKRIKERFGNDNRCRNFIRIYLDNVDEEHDHCINGVLLTPYCYGGRYLLEEGDTDYDEPFWCDGKFYEGVKNSGAYWP